MKNKIIFLVFTASIFLTIGFKKINPEIDEAATWSGHVTWIKTSRTSGMNQWLSNGLPEIHR